MISFTFTLDDLARTRFAISPMWELIASLRALRHPDEATLHLPWIAEALPIARRLELDPALAVTPLEGYIPDFLTPPPTTPLASFEDELERVRTTAADQVRAEVRKLVDNGRSAPALERLLDRPRLEVDRLCAELAEFWRLALEPHWPRVRAVLEADLLYRSRRLTEGGPAALFADLHQDLIWGESRLDVCNSCDEAVELGGNGLVLVPSAFQWWKTAAITDAPWQPTLLYPSRGVALLWESTESSAPEALEGLLGRSRAALLEALDVPRSTTELARRLELSAGGVSQHLSTLRDAGLVGAQRHGRSVLYLRTPAADGLLGAAAPAEPAAAG